MPHVLERLAGRLEPVTSRETQEAPVRDRRRLTREARLTGLIGVVAVIGMLFAGAHVSLFVASQLVDLDATFSNVSLLDFGSRD